MKGKIKYIIIIILGMFLINNTVYAEIVDRYSYISYYDTANNPIGIGVQCGVRLHISTCEGGTYGTCIADKIYFGDGKNDFISTNIPIYRGILVSSRDVTNCLNEETKNSERYATEGSGFACGTSLYITTCFENQGEKYCNYFNSNENISGVINAKYLTESESTCPDSGYYDAEGYYYVKKGASSASRELVCGAKLHITKCNGEQCYYDSYTNKLGKTKKVTKLETISQNEIISDINETGCVSDDNKEVNPDEEEDNIKVCTNDQQLNIGNENNQGWTFSVCYDNNSSSSEVKDLVKSLVSCAKGTKLNESKIIAGDIEHQGKYVSTRNYTVYCENINNEIPKLSVSSGIVNSSGYGEIKVSVNSTVGISSYYYSETMNTPTKTSKWIKVDSNNFTIKTTPGVIYIWAKDKNGNISSTVSGAVIDTVNTTTTLKTIELKDANGNSLAMKSTNKISYNNIGISSIKYSQLSSKTIADGFNPFDMEYDLEVDSPTITVFATLTSNDAEFISGYEPRTVNLSYGTNTILIKIKNKEGKIRTYTINATRKDSRNADNTLNDLKLSVGKINFNSNVTNYKIEIPKNTDNVVVTAKLSSDLSSYVDGFEPGVVNITDNTTVKLIKVRSQTGSNRTYVLTFIKEGTDEITKKSLQLFSLSLSDGYLPFEENVANYNVTVDYKTNVIDINAAVNDPNSKIKYFRKDNDNYIETTDKGIPLNIGDNYINIEITDKDGNIAYYRLTIIRKEFGLDISNDTTLKDLKILNYNIDFDPMLKDYQVKIKTEKSLIISAIPESNRAEVFITGNDQLTGFSTVRVKVVAENGEYQIYSIDIKKDPFNKQLEMLAVIAILVIFVLSSGIIIIKKKYRAKKDYYKE